MRRVLSGAVLVLVVAAPLAAGAQVPPLLDLQGFLRTVTGQPIHKKVALAVSIYPSETGGVAAWSEVQPALQVSQGRFSTVLGQEQALPAGLLEALPEAWVGLSVDGSSELPRQRLVSVPYALMARTSLELDCQGCIGTGELAPGAVGTSQLADGSVTASKLSGGAVYGDLLVDGTVTAGKVSFPWAAGTYPGGPAADVSCSGCVSGDEVALATLTGAHLGNGSVGSNQMADGAVTTAKIGDGAVGTAALAYGAVTADRIGEPCASGQVLKSNGAYWTCGPDLDTPYSAGQGISLVGSQFSLDMGTVDARFVNEGQVGAIANAMLKDEAVTADKMAAQSVTGFKLAEGAVWTGKLADGAVTGIKLGDQAITTAKIADGQVTLAKMAACGEGKVPLYSGGAWTCGDPDPKVGALTANLWCKVNAAGTALVCNVTPITPGPQVYSCPKSGATYCSGNTCIGQLSTSSTCTTCVDYDGCECSSQACTLLGRLISN